MNDPADALRRDLNALAEQERLLQLPCLDADWPWRLGCRLREVALARGAALTIEVRMGGQRLFHHAMPGTLPSNADWARRKRNAVELLGHSSYRIGRQLALDGTTLEAKMGLATRDYASHGGSVPLRLAAGRAGAGLGDPLGLLLGLLVGSVTVSGLPQREDHDLVVATVAELAGLQVPALPA